MSFHLSGGDLITGGPSHEAARAARRGSRTAARPRSGVAAAEDHGSASVMDDKNRTRTRWCPARPPRRALPNEKSSLYRRWAETTRARRAEPSPFSFGEQGQRGDPRGGAMPAAVRLLPALFKQTQWQRSSVHVPVPPGLGGDASFSAGLGPAAAESRGARREHGGVDLAHARVEPQLLQERGGGAHATSTRSNALSRRRSAARAAVDRLLTVVSTTPRGSCTTWSRRRP